MKQQHQLRQSELNEMNLKAVMDVSTVAPERLELSLVTFASKCIFVLHQLFYYICQGCAAIISLKSQYAIYY